MARYLAYTSPALGHLYPIISTLDELRRRGHEVSVRTLASELTTLRRLGYSAAPIPADVERLALDDWKARSQAGRLTRTVKTFSERAEIEVGYIQRVLEEERPDALYIDINSWGAACVAEGSQVPWATFCPYLLPLPSRDAPPFGLGFRPRKDLFGRVRDQVFERLVDAQFDRAGLERLNGIRARLGLSRLVHVRDAILLAPLLVYYTAEPFEYPRSDWPQSVRLVGPGIWAPPAKPPRWLEEIDRPLVLVTASTEYQDDGALIGTALDALASEDLSVVVTTAAHDPAAFPAPRNARVERFVSHGPLLARTSCVVCHGGMGITQKALSAGVPLCVVPWGRDQIEVARHVEVANAGTVVKRSRLEPSRLRAAVRDALPKKNGAERIAAGFAAAGGPVAAADALEELIGGRPPPSARA